MQNYRIRVALITLIIILLPALGRAQDVGSLLTGGLSSSVAPSPVSAPSLSLLNGNVSIATATSGATIRYTLDGSIPTIGSGTIYTVPFTVATSATATIKTFAYKSGLPPSAVVTAIYNPNGPTIYLTTNPTRPVGPIRLTEGASGPDIVYQLRDAFGRPIAVSAGATIGIKIRLVGGSSLAVNKSGTGQGCTVIDATKGIIGFSWGTAGITIPAAGNYDMQWTINTLPYPVGDRLAVVIQGPL